MYVMDMPSNWEDYLYLVEFSNNNRYHSSLKMGPFKSLYRSKCKTLLCWDNPIDRVVIGLEMLKDAVKKNLKVTQDRYKRYADKGRTFKEFQVGEHVFLKVRAKKSSLKLGSCKKLAARYC